jgi:hypothetical protein
VDTVSGGPYDLGHVGPHRVEARSGERSAIAGSGHGYLSGFRLAPDAAYDLGGPVIVSQPLIAGIYGPGHNVVLAFLEAPEAINADIVSGVSHLFGLEHALAMDVIYTSGVLDASPASQAPVNLKIAVLGNLRIAGRGLFDFYMILLGHFPSPGLRD